MEFIFGYAYNTISEDTNWVKRFIIDNWGCLLDDFSSGHLSEARLPLFARKIHEKGASLNMYNGYKHMHAVKY
jgi:hypothetical protein